MKQLSIHGLKRRALRKNKNGGIEGLPLQLMIIIMVATLGTAIIVGWMGNIEEPHSINKVEVDSNEIELGSNMARSGSYYCVDEDVVITVYDQSGNPLEGATVILSGLGVKDSNGGTPHANTDSNGTVVFKDLNLKMTGTHGYLDVEVSKSGYGENSSCRITVVA